MKVELSGQTHTERRTYEDGRKDQDNAYRGRIMSGTVSIVPEARKRHETASLSQSSERSEPDPANTLISDIKPPAL